MLFFVPPFSSSFPLYYLVIFLHLFLILFHFSVPFESENGAESVQIATTTGKIRGTVVKLEGQGTDEWTDVAVFLGIPYAEPPTGPLRFEKTIPLAENATRQMDAIEMPKMCVPHHRLDNWTSDWSDYGEDCLFLNIFTPWPNNRRVSLMPLLVLIYVGGFEVGIRRYRNYEEIGHKFLAHDIVVATVQFRIGFLGFASSGNEQMPGNFGYWDLTEALRWLCANAKAFGADPTRVTFHGYSASGTSVATLALSPHSRDLFQQTIQMSGPIFSSRAAGDRTVNTTRKIAVGVGCLDSAQLKECLKAKSVDQLFDAMDAIGSTLADVNYNLFGPVFDDDFLPANFSQLVRESTPKRSIIGVTELEPLAFTLIFGNNSLRHLAIPRDEFATFGREQMRMYMRQKAFKNEYYGQNDAEQLADEVAAFYGNLTDDENGREGKDNWFFLERTVLFLADVQFLVPFLWELREKVSNGWPLFVYVNKFVNAREIPRDFPPELHKSFHDSDHKYVLRHPYSTYKFDEDDLAMEKVMAQMFANFVQNGDPSFSDTAPWPIATHDFPFRHLAITFPELQIVTDFDLRRMRFWEQIGAKYPQYNLILGTSENDNFGTRPNDINWPQMVAIAAMAMLIGICYLG